MKKSLLLILLLAARVCSMAQTGTVPVFSLENSADITLTTSAQPYTPFDQCGRRFAVLGEESGRFEAWAWPLKLFRNFEFSFYIGSSTQPIHGRDIVRHCITSPAVTSLVYTFQSFTVKAHFLAAADRPGALILLEVNSTESLSVVGRFLPVLQPMWPGGLGGQYAYWNDELKAYIISEPTRKNHGFIGSPAAAGMSYTPAHMLSDNPSEFRIDIADPEAVRHRFIPIAMAGGQGNRDSLKAVYQYLAEHPQQVFQEAADHYRALRARTLSVTTPDEAVNKALEWAKVSYDKLMVDHPTLGCGMTAGLGMSGSSGRPGFGWFFGGDTYINSLSMARLGDFKTVRQMLGFMTAFQRDDGKMAHEISQAVDYVDWFGDYPYAYIHGDTSPYFIVAVHDYVQRSGDVAFAKKHWPAIKEAWQWSLATDENKDGLMDNSAAGLGALEYGKLAGGIATDIYLGAVWTQATRAMADLARWVNDRRMMRTADQCAGNALDAFDRRFWDEDEKVYAYAFGNDGSHVKPFSPWNSVGMMWELGREEARAATMSRLAGSELMTDWGVRSISHQSEYYEALNYNYGAVWPFLNSWASTALLVNRFVQQGYALWRSTVEHVYAAQPGAVGEVFSGTLFSWPQEAVAHQGFSTAGTVLPMVKGLLGLEGSAMEKQLMFAPALPADWKSLQVNHHQLGTSVFQMALTRSSDKMICTLSQNQGNGYRFLFKPVFGPGVKVASVEIDGREHDFKRIETARYTQPVIEVELTEAAHEITLKLVPAVEVLPVWQPPVVGDESCGLRILSITRTGDVLLVQCEGLPGQSYELGLTHADLVASVSGGTLSQQDACVTFAVASDKPGYQKHRIELLLKR